MNSQDIFGQIQITFIKELLLGHTVAEAEKTMGDLEDSFIKKNKGTKYCGISYIAKLGDSNAMIY